MGDLQSASDTCALCCFPLPQKPIYDKNLPFCCPGCQTVFAILSAKQQLEAFQDHPLFQQACRSGLISNPHLLETIREKQAAQEEIEVEKIYLEIQEMWCPSCAEVIRLILLQEKGVRKCFVDYATDLASIEYSPRFIAKSSIENLISSLGYKPMPLENRQNKAVSFDLYLRFIIAAFFSLNIMMFAYPLYATYFNYDDQGVGRLFAWISAAAALPVIGYSAWPIFKRGWTSLSAGIPGMELLVMLSVSSAFAVSLYELLKGGDRVYFDSMTVIIAFVLLGKIIETKAKFSAKESLFRLTRSLPKRGRKRLENGETQFVPLKEIKPGDILLAYTGEKIVLDGTIIEGEGMCDESLMTGESFPVLKEVGGTVLGGAIVQHGWMAYQVATTHEVSALQKIVAMVEQDLGSKSQYVRAADKLVRWFVPTVVGIAMAAALGVFLLGISEEGRTVKETAFLRMITVLLISCPCAIGIAAPLAEAYLMQQLACLGAIVRNRGCLTHLGNETILIFDKTGTITEGRFQLQNGIEALSSYHLGALKALASHSNHPIAFAIAQGLPGDTIVCSFDSIEEFPGKGMRGVYQERAYTLGSGEFLSQNGIGLIECNASGITSVVYFAEDKQCLASLTLGDRIKDSARQVVQQCAPAKTWLLSGDSKEVVEWVAKACGFSNYKAGCVPLIKREYVEDLRNKGEIVCMIGDGVNDAPALTQAHVGIAMGSATDISIQVSDILLTGNRLDVIPQIRSLAQKGRKVIRQNLFWAFFYNVIGIGLAACGLLSPIFAAFAMVASSLIVLFNAQRLTKRSR